MTHELIAYCGLYCGACSFRLAHEDQSFDHLRAMPERYAAHKERLPDACPGCRLENQCGPCAIRDCARDRSLLHCGQCEAFPCERLRRFDQDGVPHHAAAIANLRDLNALGPEAWLARQAAEWTCGCGAARSWYQRTCRNGHRAGGEIVPLQVPDALAQAVRLAQENHAGLRSHLPFLPERTDARFLARLEYVAREGTLLGLQREGRLQAFLGGVILDDYRNAGPAAYCPDWCHGAAAATGAFDAYRDLYRALASRWKRRGVHIHAVSLYATEQTALEAFSATGFGRIMLDAARPTMQLRQELGREAARGCSVRRAVPADAQALAELNEALADHIAAAPVLLPGARGRAASDWRDWLGTPQAVAFVCEDGGGLAGYIKAGDPQEDVSDAVHAPTTLAISGMFIRPERRGQGTARALLAALADHAGQLGRDLLSVDCETTNPEAFAFWSRMFRPLAWGLERRT
jgi:GNAT superfamily N-acetyltransferase